MFKMIDVLKKYKYPLVLVAVFALAYRTWLSFDVYVGGDWWYEGPETTREFLKYSAWSSLNFLGDPNLILWSLPIDMLYGIFGYFGYGSNVTEKLLVFWPFIFLAPFFAYLLVKYIVKSEAGAFVGALVFSANTYYLAINTQGHFMLSLAATWSLLGFYWLIKGLDENKKHLFVASLLVFFWAGSYDFRIFYLDFFLIFGYIFGHFLIGKKAEWKKFAAYAGAAGLVIVGLNLYWIWPSVAGGTLTENRAISRGIIGKNFWLDISNPLTLFHPFWTGSEPEWFESHRISLYFWIIPIAALAGLWLNRRNAKIVFFGIVAIVGILLGKQGSDPFGGLYAWLFENFPGFNAFREATKLHYLVIVGYSVLIGAFIGSLWRRVEGKKVRKVYKVGKLLKIENYQINKIVAQISAILMAGVFLINLWPVSTGEMGDMFRPREASDESRELNRLISQGQDYYRTLWVPSESAFAYYDLAHPKVKLIYACGYTWKYLDSSLTDSIDCAEEDENRLLLNRDFSSYLLDMSNVRYVVFSEESASFAAANLGYLSKIGNEKFVRRSVYENKDYCPRIYVSAEVDSIWHRVAIRPVDFRMINPATFVIGLKNVSGPTYLNLSDSYHAGWRARIGESSWIESLLRADYFLPQNRHFENDARLNYFLINPEEDCRKYSCRRNADGSWDMQVYLYFWPQSHYYAGLIVSIVTLVVSLSFLGVQWLRSRGKEVAA